MARIDVEEARRERVVVVVAQFEAEHVAIEIDHLVDPLDGHHDVAQPQGPGAEA